MLKKIIYYQYFIKNENNVTDIIYTDIIYTISNFYDENFIFLSIIIKFNYTYAAFSQRILLQFMSYA